MSKNLTIFPHNNSKESAVPQERREQGNGVVGCSLRATHAQSAPSNWETNNNNSKENNTKLKCGRHCSFSFPEPFSGA